MEILVCIKQVPDDSEDVRLDNVDKVAKVVNAFDTYALEMAVRFREANGGTVVVATVGDCEAELKSCLAVGAQDAYKIADPAFEGADEAAIAQILAKGIAKIEELRGAKFDMIFCGKEATDFAKGQVGIMLANQMGYGVTTDVVAVDPADGGVCVKQETETGYNLIDMATPCVVTIQKPDYDPRYPTIKTKMAARKAKINAITAADAGVGEVANLTKVLKVYEPPKKQAGIKIQEETVADSVIKAVAIMAEAKVL